MGPQATGLKAAQILFVSSNSWDALAATWYGYTTLWVNRQNQPFEELGTPPSRIGTSLHEVLSFFSCNLNVSFLHPRFLHMTARTNEHRLQVATELHQFINQQVLPGTGVDAAAFWQGFDALVADLAPKNIALLAERERRGDLPALCEALLARIALESGMPVPLLSPELLAQLASHPLSGNVRELENLLHRAVAMGDGDALHADFDATEPTPLAESSLSTATFTATAPSTGIPNDLQAFLDQQERDILVKVLQETGFNRTATAQRLGLSLRQIRYRIERLNIATPQDNEPQDP